MRAGVVFAVVMPFTGDVGTGADGDEGVQGVTQEQLNLQTDLISLIGLPASSMPITYVAAESLTSVFALQFPTLVTVPPVQFTVCPGLQHI
jgi:hypothetical protein